MNQNNRLEYNVSHETLYSLIKICLLVVLIVSVISPINYNAIETVTGLTTDEYLLIEKDSEMILAGENYNKVTGIASITKLMSYYVFMEKIEKDKIDIDKAMVPISDEIVDNLAKNSDLSGVYFDYNQKYPLKTMLNLMLVYSDNGATKAIAEFLFKDEETAVKYMNDKAMELGMSNTRYYNTTGLTMRDYKNAQLNGSSPKDYNVSTAKEQLILAKSILKNEPQILDIVSKSYVTFKGTKLYNFDLMLKDGPYEYPGVKGLKTGSSLEAGYCFLGYFIDPITNKEYLSIVLDSSSQTKRFNDTTHLYNWLGTTEMKTIIEKDQKFNINIKGATKSIYEVKSNAQYQIPNGDENILERQQFVYNPQYFDENNKLITDIPAGETIGSYVYALADDDADGNEFESLTSEPNKIKVQVISDQKIKKEGIISKIFTGITNFYINVFETI